ncbi:MAG TPA: DUF3459 domain-containing protein, partial [Mycobacteriales bacterium]|nr:DUF3459 domain-containing protein [Mycobacteriales bacterium]
AVLLTSPYTPMLFMGEEWGARTPWQFFSDHEGELAEAVRGGRRAEFAAHGWVAEDVPDPQDEATFRRSALDWAELDESRAATLLGWHRSLLALRRAWPELSDGRRDRVEVTFDEEARWLTVRRGRLAVACNLSPERQVVGLPAAPKAVVLASAAGFVFADGQVEIDGESVAVVELIT